MIHPLIIVGAGPAGLSAALYAARSGIAPLVLEQGVPGGQLLLTDSIENYPGAGNVTGKTLAETLVRQAITVGARIEEGIHVEWVEIENRIKILKTNKGELRAKTLIAATGSFPRTLNVPGEKKLTGKGVSYCALCDAPFFKGKSVTVVGGGDSAAGESLFLARYVEKLVLVHHKERLKAEWLLQKDLGENKKIQILNNEEIKSVSGEHKVESVVLQNINTGEIHEFQTDGVFIFIGSIPQTGYLKGLNILGSNQLVLADEFTQTVLPGVFAAGEVRAGSLRQIVACAGDGAAAAMKAVHYLTREDSK